MKPSAPVTSTRRRESSTPLTARAAPRRAPHHEPTPSAEHPLPLAAQIVDDPVADDDLVRPPGGLVRNDRVPLVHFVLEVPRDVALRLRVPAIGSRALDPGAQVGMLEADGV